MCGDRYTKTRILTATYKKWEVDEEDVWKNIVPGQVYMLVTMDNITAQVIHQEDYTFKDELDCIQPEDNIVQLKQQQHHQELKPSYLYLALAFSFNQMTKTSI